MSILAWPATLIIGLIISASTKLHAVIFGQPVTIPALWLAAAAVVLVLAAMVLYLARCIAQDRQRSCWQPAARPVYVITTLQ
jgi:hypothetical protein